MILEQYWYCLKAILTDNKRIISEENVGNLATSHYGAHLYYHRISGALARY